MSITQTHKVALDLLRALALPTEQVVAVDFHCRIGEMPRVTVERYIDGGEPDLIAESYLLHPERID